MNNKGQFGFIKILFISFAFIILFALALAPLITTAVGISIDTGNVTGLEKFFLGGLNIWVLIGFVLFVIGSLVWGFQSE